MSWSVLQVGHVGESGQQRPECDITLQPGQGAPRQWWSRAEREVAAVVAARRRAVGGRVNRGVAVGGRQRDEHDSPCGNRCPPTISTARSCAGTWRDRTGAVEPQELLDGRRVRPGRRAAPRAGRGGAARERAVADEVDRRLVAGDERAGTPSTTVSSSVSRSASSGPRRARRAGPSAGVARLSATRSREVRAPSRPSAARRVRRRRPSDASSVFDQAPEAAQSATGTPSSSQITLIGSGKANSSIRSTSSGRRPSRRASPAAISSIRGRMLATWPGRERR